MKAVCWHASQDVRVEDVPQPKLLNRHDAIIKTTLTAICGSDLHLYNGWIPTMEKGDILGHEFMGEVVEVGTEVTNLKKGDRVVVPFTICCGRCQFCTNRLWSLCDNTNPSITMAEKLYGYSGAGLFGYSHIYGGFAGGQAEYVRVPFADVGPIKIENGFRDEQVLFLSDILPTAYMAVENCNIKSTDTVAVWGCGPVGLLAIQCAWMLGAHRVIALDHVKGRLETARLQCKAEVLDYRDENVVEKLKFMTAGRGPEACIDAVGMEAHGAPILEMYDRARQAMRLETDRPHALRQAIYACAKGGTVSVPGVYGGLVDKFPLGIAFAKGLTFKMGQTHVPNYMRLLLDRIQRGDIDPSFVITHRAKLDEAPELYRTFNDRKDECIKVVLKP
jgi:threonine dehydrogenase-like Zn-dependent dehydrogenase